MIVYSIAPSLEALRFHRLRLPATDMHGKLQKSTEASGCIAHLHRSLEDLLWSHTPHEVGQGHQFSCQDVHISNEMR